VVIDERDGAAGRDLGRGDAHRVEAARAPVLAQAPPRNPSTTSCSSGAVSSSLCMRGLPVGAARAAVTKPKRSREIVRVAAPKRYTVENDMRRHTSTSAHASLRDRPPSPPGDRCAPRRRTAGVDVEARIQPSRRGSCRARSASPRPRTPRARHRPTTRSPASPTRARLERNGSRARHPHPFGKSPLDR
jgi:hypothetical protein